MSYHSEVYQEFIATSQEVMNAKSDLALRSKRLALCKILGEVAEEIKYNPYNRFMDLTGKLTVCVADPDPFEYSFPENGLALIFSYDDEPTITSTDDEYLIPRKPDVDLLDDIQGMYRDFTRGRRTWSGYDTHITTRLSEIRQSFPTWGDGEFETTNKFVGDSVVDDQNVVLRPPLTGTSYAIDEFLPHMNENADFFKRFIAMGVPNRLETLGHEKDDYERFNGGLLSASPITIDMFMDCRKIKKTRFGRTTRIYMKKDVDKPGHHYFLTEKGFLCKDLDGNPFVILGVIQRRFHDESDDETELTAERYSIVMNLRLALHAEDHRRIQPVNLPGATPLMTNTETERVKYFLFKFLEKFLDGRLSLGITGPNDIPSLKHSAFQAVMDDMVSIASRNDGLRCLQPTSREKSNLIVISRGNMYLMSRLPNSVAFGGTYYRIDEWVGHVGEHPEYVAAWIRSCGVLNGERVQPFRLMRADGTFVKGMIDFAFGFDDEEELEEEEEQDVVQDVVLEDDGLEEPEDEPEEDVVQVQPKGKGKRKRN